MLTLERHAELQHTENFYSHAEPGNVACLLLFREFSLQKKVGQTKPNNETQSLS